MAGSFYQKWLDAVNEMERQVRLKDARIKFLVDHYKARGADEITISFHIDKDYFVSDHSKKSVKFADYAAAYAPGAIIEFFQQQAIARKAEL